MFAKLKSYVNLKSLSWWGGALMVAMGIAMAIGYDKFGVSDFSVVLASLMGSTETSPAELILFGLSVIGLRGKLERSA